jgi:transposase InsO family protein
VRVVRVRRALDDDLGGRGAEALDQHAEVAGQIRKLRQRAHLQVRAAVGGQLVFRRLRLAIVPHRALIARKYDGHLRRGPGRPRVTAEIREWVVRTATENRSWGYTRIQGALANLDHHVSRGTIANILRQRGIEPAPERQKRTTWKEFLSNHRDVLAAADFFTVEVWTAGGLTRFAVLFVIHLATRRVEIAGILPEPDSAWVIQCGRQLTDPVDGCLRGKRFLLHDRDPRFTDAFRDTLAVARVETLRLPPRSPNLNAYAERFVRTIRNRA